MKRYLMYVAPVLSALAVCLPGGSASAEEGPGRSEVIDPWSRSEVLDPWATAAKWDPSPQAELRDPWSQGPQTRRKKGSGIVRPTVTPTPTPTPSPETIFVVPSSPPTYYVTLLPIYCVMANSYASPVYYLSPSSPQPGYYDAVPPPVYCAPTELTAVR
jgi:hypothetical protein